MISESIFYLANGIRQGVIKDDFPSDNMFRYVITRFCIQVAFHGLSDQESCNEQLVLSVELAKNTCRDDEGPDTAEQPPMQPPKQKDRHSMEHCNFEGCPQSVFTLWCRSTSVHRRKV